MLLRKNKKNVDIIKENEYLIMDRGFIDIEFISKLVKKGIKVIIPAKKNMNIYQTAKKEAIENNKWTKHPNINREGQEVTLVTDMEGEWIDEKYVYIVMLSTDVEMTAAEIVRTYEQRTEIEEDFRQIKDHWNLATFTSTKYDYIMCHIAMLLLGYNIFNMFKSTEIGAKYRNKNMSTIMKSESFMKFHPSEIHYFIGTNKNFCILETREIFMLFGKCKISIQEELLKYL